MAEKRKMLKKQSREKSYFKGAYDYALPIERGKRIAMEHVKQSTVLHPYTFSNFEAKAELETARGLKNEGKVRSIKKRKLKIENLSKENKGLGKVS